MKRKVLLIILCILFACLALFSGFKLCQQWRESRAGKKTYEALAQYATPQASSAPKTDSASSLSPDGTLPESPDASEEEDDTIWPVVDFEALQAINPEVVGWIIIPGTNINYPVVQGPDNNYYLYRLFDGSHNDAGSIFMDYRNERDMSSRNTILYGHRMNDGSMFKQILEYKNQSFYDEHPIGLFLTPDENYKIEFVSGYVTDMNDDSWKIEFASDAEFSLWLEDTIEKSAFTGTAKPSPQDRVLTLSTCARDFYDARFILVGILK